MNGLDRGQRKQTQTALGRALHVCEIIFTTNDAHLVAPCLGGGSPLVLSYLTLKLPFLQGTSDYYVPFQVNLAFGLCSE